MTGRPSKTIEQILSRYEQYDVMRRNKHIPHPSKAGFIEGFEDVGFGMSKQTLLNYMDHYSLPWPLLPEDEHELVWVLFGQAPFHLTWVRQSVATALGRPVADIVGQPSVDLMRHGVGFDDQTNESLRRLKTDPMFKEACIEHAWIDVADGRSQLTDMTVRYTGERTDRFYVSAHPLGAPYVPDDADVFNVQPDLFYEMKPTRLPPPSLAEAMRAVKQRGIGELVDTVMLLNDHPELVEAYLNQTLPRYEFREHQD